VSDVHEAAERLRRICAKEQFDYPTELYEDDKSVLVAEWLKEHEATEITPEWLRSVCPMEMAITKRLGYVVARGSVFDIIFLPQCGSLSPALCLGTSVVKRKPTRGDIRTLARALGIKPLEQPAPVEKE
jgi:hypothetical protein